MCWTKRVTLAASVRSGKEHPGISTGCVFPLKFNRGVEQGHETGTVLDERTPENERCVICPQA